jgi:Prp8 binding protein
MLRNNNLLINFNVNIKYKNVINVIKLYKYYYKFKMFNELVPISSEKAKKEFSLYNPTLMLTGHKGEVFTGKFSNEGFLYASAGFDRNINVWEVFEEKCRNITTLTGHNNAILELTWSQDDSKIFSVSADKTVSIWDVYESRRVKKLKGHEHYINCIASTKRGPELIATGGDDCQMYIWDIRDKNATISQGFKYQITSIAFNATGEQVYLAGIDNVIKVYDIRKQQVESTLIGHTDTVTGLSVSNDGNFLLSNSMDSTIRCWDIRPYFHGNRCVKVFQGATHNFEKNLLRVAWNADDSLISAGSADRFVYIWDFNSGKIVRKFGGHNGTVNETSFNKLSNVIGSCSSDQSIILGEY